MSDMEDRVQSLEDKVKLLLEQMEQQNRVLEKTIKLLEDLGDFDDMDL